MSGLDRWLQVKPLLSMPLWTLHPSQTGMSDLTLVITNRFVFITSCSWNLVSTILTHVLLTFLHETFWSTTSGRKEVSENRTPSTF